MVHTESRAGYRMPFGKFKGECLEDLPDDYLDWLLTIELREPLLDFVLDEADRRNAELRKRTYQPPPCPSPLPTNLVTIITRWHQDLCRRWHPDKGGSVEVMAAINDAHDRLKKMLAEVGA